MVEYIKCLFYKKETTQALNIKSNRMALLDLVVVMNCGIVEQDVIFPLFYSLHR